MTRLAALLVLLWLLSGCRDDGAVLRLVVLDVGEGQAVLLQRGIHGVLVDAAHHWRWRNVELTALWPKAPSGTDLNAMSLVSQVRYGRAMALIMGDAGNLRSYPAESVLRRLERWGGRVLRTDRDGDVYLVLHDDVRGAGC